MTGETEQSSERIIKSKHRVQKHGEVFTPMWMVDKMLNEPGIAEECQSLESIFLEPSVGEGAFLCEILRRKLGMVVERFASTLGQYENFSLYALSTLYGIELLEDNTQVCAMNLFHVFFEQYENVAIDFEKRPKTTVLDSAKTIIAKNVIQGNFLTEQRDNGKPIILNEWKAQGTLSEKTKTIKVLRTEYTLEDLKNKRMNAPGSMWEPATETVQLSFFDEAEVIKVKEDDEIAFLYTVSPITRVYREEMESNER